MHTKVEVEIKLTPDQLAEAFISWGNDEQGEFFNLIGQHFKDAYFNAELQCCYMADKVSIPGKHFIYTLANFIKARGIPSTSPKNDVLLNSYETYECF